MKIRVNDVELEIGGEVTEGDLVLHNSVLLITKVEENVAHATLLGVSMQGIRMSQLTAPDKTDVTP